MDKEPDQNVFWIDKRFKILEATHEIIKTEGDQETTIKIEPIMMAVLLRLILANGGIVSRAFLMENVWMNYEGGEDGLNQAISKLRKIFDDNAKASKIIETIPKKGYRIIASIGKVHDNHLVRITKTFRESEVTQLVALIEYLKQPRHSLIFFSVCSFAIAALYLLYKIIYAIVWS